MIDVVGEIVEALEAEGLTPVLVGGMAMVVLGSRRVTRDFDFLVSGEGLDPKKIMAIFYKRGFELASRLNNQGDITVTIDNQNIASMRLKLDAPSSVYFFNRKIGLRIDLLFDFPVRAAEIVPNAVLAARSSKCSLLRHREKCRRK